MKERQKPRTNIGDGAKGERKALVMDKGLLMSAVG